jgi:hypothetical protein
MHKRLPENVERLFSSFLLIFKREAGTPSAPAAGEELNSEQAVSMSESYKSIFDIAGTLPVSL